MTAGDWSSRLAGALLLIVGLLNLALGLLSLLTDQIRLSPGVAGGLVSAGLATAAAGALVWRGSRRTTIIAFTVFAVLLVFQLTQVVADDGEGGGGLAEEPLTRFGVLGLLVVTLGLAAWRRRRRPPTFTPR